MPKPKPKPKCHLSQDDLCGYVLKKCLVGSGRNSMEPEMAAGAIGVVVQGCDPRPKADPNPNQACTSVGHLLQQIARMDD